MQDRIYHIDHLGKSFHSINGNKVQVLHELSMDIQVGKITAVLGPSGCGKSTLLNILAGFEEYEEGSIPIQGEMSVVFQSPALFPWLTVEENVEYGLKRRKIPKKERKERVDRFLKLVQLEEYSFYYPRELSGGMQQRVALARTLVLHPSVLLMDEPFSALDPKLRAQMQHLTLELWETLNQTILIVTHDVEEALMLADTIYVMNECSEGNCREIPVPWKEKGEEIRKTQEFFELKNYLLSNYLNIESFNYNNTRRK